MFTNPAALLRPVQAAGKPGVLVTVDGVSTALMVFTVRDGAIVAIDTITDPDRVSAVVASEEAGVGTGDPTADDGDSSPDAH